MNQESNSTFALKNKLPQLLIVGLVLLGLSFGIYYLRHQTSTITTYNDASQEAAGTDTPAETIKNTFLTMKKALETANTTATYLQISSQYFTQEFQALVKNKLQSLTDDAEPSLVFWQTFFPHGCSEATDINDLEVTFDGDNHARLLIKGTASTWTTNLILEDDDWRYNGQEELLSFVDEDGEEYQIVTPETAEYEIAIDEEGRAVKVMKAGQALLADEEATNAGISPKTLTPISLDSPL